MLMSNIQLWSEQQIIMSLFSHLIGACQPNDDVPCLILSRLPSPRLINKLQPGSVKKINHSQLNWHKVRPKCFYPHFIELFISFMDPCNKQKKFPIIMKLFRTRPGNKSFMKLAPLQVTEPALHSNPALSWDSPVPPTHTVIPILLSLRLPAAGEPRELHQSHLGLRHEAQRHL